MKLLSGALLSIGLVGNLFAMDVPPAVNAKLQECAAHAQALANHISQSIQDAKELERARKNAKTATALATDAAQKAAAAQERKRYFAALGKDQTKVDKPELVENCFNAFKELAVISFITYMVTVQQAMRQAEQSSNIQ